MHAALLPMLISSILQTSPTPQPQKATTAETTAPTTVELPTKVTELGDVNGDDFIDYAVTVETVVLSDNVIVQQKIVVISGISGLVIRQHVTSADEILKPLGDLNNDGFDDYSIIKTSPPVQTETPPAQEVIWGKAAPADEVLYPAPDITPAEAESSEEPIYVVFMIKAPGLAGTYVYDQGRLHFYPKKTSTTDEPTRDVPIQKTCTVLLRLQPTPHGEAPAL